MGIIIKQSFKGTIWSYLGVLIGFVTTTYLFPNYLSTDTIGLFSLLVAYSVLASQFASLGMNGITLRLFPRFRNKEKGHHGYLFVSLIVLLIGFSIFMLIFWLFSPWLAANNLDKSALFSKYIYLLPPITFFTLAYSYLDNYNKLLYDAVLGTFLQEFLQRLLILVITVLYIFDVYSLNVLVIGYASVLCVKGFIIFFSLLFRNEIHLSRPEGFITAALKKEMIGVAVFSVLSSMGTAIIFNIDKLIINQFLGLSQTGIYTIAFFFATLIVIPSRPLLKISGTLIADAWNNNQPDKVKEIYYKSCLNQFIIGGFLFLGIWTNIDNILAILGPEYEHGKWVIFFVGLGNLFDMATGANANVIAYSKYYKVSSVFIGSLIVIFTALLYLFIPIWGIAGAAAAVAVALFLNNFARYIFLWTKYGFQPFNYRFPIIAIFYLLIYTALEFIPQQVLVIDILLRGSIISISTFSLFLFFPLSKDISDILKMMKKKILGNK